MCHEKEEQEGQIQLLREERNKTEETLKRYELLNAEQEEEKAMFKSSIEKEIQFRAELEKELDISRNQLKEAIGEKQMTEEQLSTSIQEESHLNRTLKEELETTQSELHALRLSADEGCTLNQTIDNQLQVISNLEDEVANLKTELKDVKTSEEETVEIAKSQFQVELDKKDLLLEEVKTQLESRYSEELGETLQRSIDEVVAVKDQEKQRVMEELTAKSEELRQHKDTVISKLKDKIREKIEQNKKLNVEHKEKLGNAVKEHRNAIEEIQEKLTKEIAVKEELASELERLTAEVEQLKELEFANNDLSQSIAAREEEIGGLREDCQTERRKNDETNLRLQEALHKAQNLKLDLERTQTEKIELDIRLQSSAQKEDLEKSVSEKDKLIGQLKRRLKELRSENKELSHNHAKDLTEKDDEIGQLKATFEEKMAEIQASHILKKEALIEKLGSEIDGEAAKRDQVVDELQQKLQQKELELQRIVNDEEQLRIQLQQAKEDERQMQDAHDRAVDGLKTELQNALSSRDAATELDTLLEDIKMQNETLLRDLNEKDIELELVKSNFRSSEEELQLDLEKVIQEKDDLEKSFREELSSLESNLMDMTAKSAELEAQLESINLERDTSHEEIGGMKSELDDAAASKDALSSELDKAKKNFEKIKIRLKNNIKNSRDEKEKLQGEIEKITAEKIEISENIRREFEEKLNEKDNVLVGLREELAVIRKEKEVTHDELRLQMESLQKQEIQAVQTEQTFSAPPDISQDYESLKLDLEKAKQEKEQVTDIIKAEFDHIYQGLRGDLENALAEKADIERSSHITYLELEKRLVEKVEESEKLQQTIQEKENEDISWKEELVKSKTELFTRATSLHEEKKTLEEIRTELEASLYEAKSKNDSLKMALEKLQSEKDVTQSQLEGSLQKALAEKGEVCQHLRDEFESAFSEKEAVLRNLKELLDNARDERDKCDSDCKKSEAELQRQKDDFENVMQEKENVITNLRERIEGLREERGVIEEKAKDVLAEVKEQYEGQIKGLEMSLEKVQSEKEEMFSRLLADSEKGREELSEGLQREFDVLLSDKDKTLQELQETLDNNRKELNDALSAKQILDADVRNLHEDVESLHHKVEQVTNDKETAKQKHAEEIQRLMVERDEEAETARIKVRDLESEREQGTRDLESKLKDLNEERVQLELAFAEKDEELEVTTQRINDLEDDTKMKERLIEDLYSNVTELKDVKEALENEKEGNSRALAEKDVKITDLAGQVDNLTEHVKGLDSSKSELEELVEKLLEVKKGVEDELEEGKTTLELFYRDIENLQQENEAMGRNLDDVNEKLGGADLKIEESVKEKERLSLENDALRRDIEIVQRKNDETTKENEILLQENTALHEKVNELKNSVAEVAQTISEVAGEDVLEKMKTLEEEVQRLRQQGVQVPLETKVEPVIEQHQMASAPPDVSGYVQETEGLTSELNNLKNELNVAHTELENSKVMNEKLKKKLRQLLKKRGKAEEGDIDVEVLKEELQNARQDKIDTEKVSQELRLELEEFVSEREKIVSDLRDKMQLVQSEKDKGEILNEKYEKLVSEKVAAVKELTEKVEDQKVGQITLEQEKAALERDIAQASQEVVDLKNERDDILDALSHTKEELLNHEKGTALEEKTSKINSLEEKLRGVATDHEAEITNLKSEYEEMLAQRAVHMENTQAELRSTTEQLEEMVGKYDRLNKEREDIESLRTTFDHIVSGLREDLEHALKGKSAADQLAHEFQVKLRKLEVQTGEAPLPQFKDASVDCLDLVTDIVSEKDEEIEGYVLEVDALKDEVAVLKTELDKYTTEKENLELVASQSEKDSPNEEVDGKEVTDVVKGLQEELKERNSTIQELQHKLQDLRENFGADLTELEQGLSNSEDENLTLKEKVQNLENELESNAKSKLEAEHILQGLREDLQEAMNDKSSKDRALHNLRIENDRMRKKLPKGGKQVPVILPFEIRQVAERSPLEEEFNSGYVKDIFNMSSEEPQKLGMKPQEEILLTSPTDNVITKNQGVNTESIPGFDNNARQNQETSDGVIKNDLEKKLQQQIKINSKLKQMVKGLKSEASRLTEDSEDAKKDSWTKEHTLREMRSEMESLVKDKEDMVNGFRDRLNVLAEDKGQLVENLKKEYDVILSQKDEGLSHFQTELEATREKLDSVRMELSNCKSELEVLSSNANLVAVVSDLRAENELLNGRLNEVHEEVEKHTAENSELALRNTDLEEIVTNIRGDVEAFIRHRADLEERLANTDSRVVALQSENQDMLQSSGSMDPENSEVAKMESDLENTKAQLKELKLIADEANKSLTLQRTEFEESYKVLLDEKERVLEEKIQAEHRTNDLRLEMERFVREKEEMVEAFKTRMTQAVAEQGGNAMALQIDYEKLLDERTGDLDEKMNELSKANEEILALMEDKDEMLVNLRDLENEIRASHEDKEYLGAECDELRKMIQELKTENSDLVQLLNTNAAETQGLKEQIESMISEQAKEEEKKLIQELQDQLRELTAENEKQEQELKSAIHDRENIRTKLKKDYNRLNNSLKFDLEQARDQTLEKEKSVQLLRLEVESVVKEKEQLAAVLRGQRSAQENLESSVLVASGVPPPGNEGFASTLQEMKSEMNRLSTEYDKSRKDKDKLYTKFQRVSQGLRKDLETLTEEREQSSKQLDKLQLENKELLKSVREKESAIVKMRIKFDHIGEGWRADLETSRNERDKANEELERLKSVQTDPDVTTESGELQNRNTALQEKHSSVVARCNELTARVTELEQQRNLLEYDLGICRTQLAKARGIEGVSDIPEGIPVSQIPVAEELAEVVVDREVLQSPPESIGVSDLQERFEETCRQYDEKCQSYYDLEGQLKEEREARVELEKRLTQTENELKLKRPTQFAVNIDDVESSDSSERTRRLYQYSPAHIGRKARSSVSYLGRLFRRSKPLSSLGLPRGLGRAALLGYVVLIHALALMFVFKLVT